jgi:imidazole glycerol phosphate synthase subunit HisF
METTRIMPCLDKNGRVVKGIYCVDLKDAGDLVKMPRTVRKKVLMSFTKGGASIIPAGSVFHFRASTVRQGKGKSAEQGVGSRPASFGPLRDVLSFEYGRWFGMESAYA